MNNNRLSAIELLSIGYNQGLTSEEKTVAVQQLQERKQQQMEASALNGNTPGIMSLMNAYGESTSRREERQRQAELDAKLKRLAELEAKQQAANEAHDRQKEEEAQLARLAHLEQAEKAGLI